MNSLPFVTVIMPVLNEAAYIQRSLGSILSQDYPVDRMEVIIADGMSEDETRQIVLRLAQGSPSTSPQDKTRPLPPVILIDNPQKIVPTGLNAAIERARGSIIIRIDGHSLLGPDYVMRSVENLIQSGADCVGGATTSVGEGYVGKAIAVAVSSLLGAGKSPFRTQANHSEPLAVETLQFPAIKREVFDRVGLFDPQMVRHQDYEFHYRIRKTGGKILLYPDLRVEYFVRKSLRALWRQYWQYGLWKGRFLRQYPESIKTRHVIPPLFVLSVILSLFLGIFFPFFASVHAALVLAYLSYLLICLAVFSFKGTGKYIPVLPLVLVTLHFSYGLALCIGLVWGRWKR